MAWHLFIFYNSFIIIKDPVLYIILQITQYMAFIYGFLALSDKKNIDPFY